MTPWLLTKRFSSFLPNTKVGPGVTYSDLQRPSVELGVSLSSSPELLMTWIKICRCPLRWTVFDRIWTLSVCVKVQSRACCCHLSTKHTLFYKQQNKWFHCSLSMFLFPELIALPGPSMEFWKFYHARASTHAMKRAALDVKSLHFLDAVFGQTCSQITPHQFRDSFSLCLDVIFSSIYLTAAGKRLKLCLWPVPFFPLQKDFLLMHPDV